MYLFRNFLEDTKAYAEAEKLWCRSLTKIVKLLGQQKQWKIPWIRPRFGNGTPYRDGNPMFTALDRSRRLAINIIQMPSAAEGEPDLIYWTKKLAEGDFEQLDALVIACVLSDETLAQATELMTKWAAHGSLNGSARQPRVQQKARTPMPRRHGMPRA
jgi:hypothetical protein